MSLLFERSFFAYDSVEIKIRNQVFSASVGLFNGIPCIFEVFLLCVLRKISNGSPHR